MPLLSADRRPGVAVILDVSCLLSAPYPSSAAQPPLAAPAPSFLLCPHMVLLLAVLFVS